EKALIRQEEAEDPACIPIFWISKWVDYCDKYGLGYQLCDNSVAVLFNDYTRLMMYADGDSLRPAPTWRDGDELARLPYVSYWLRTRSDIVLHLTNGTVQMNSFQDHTKLILCPLMGAVTYIDEKCEFHTYKLSLLEEFGCTKELATRIHDAKVMVEKLLASKTSSAH
ncbi:hypothetical protein CRUP_012261, partial [Coryphaenoides rupestris]